VASRFETAQARLLTMRVSRSRLLSPVIARSGATKQSRVVGVALDCFAEFIIGPAKGGTRWLAMTVWNLLLLDCEIPGSRFQRAPE
jgi:hypothetical protein